jgi:hypothetical protein
MSASGEVESTTHSVDWLLKPLLDEQAPLILRANCIRSLALLTSASSDQLYILRCGKDHASPSSLSQTILHVQNQVDEVVEPFLRDKNSLGARISNVTHLHSFNLLALLLGKKNRKFSSSSSSSSSSNHFGKQNSPLYKSPSRRRLDQSHIPEWRRIVVSPPTGAESPASNKIFSSSSPSSSPSSPSSSPTRADQFAENFFDDMMAEHTKGSDSVNVEYVKQQQEASDVSNAFTVRDSSSRCSQLDSKVISSLVKQLTGPTHGVGKGTVNNHYPTLEITSSEIVPSFSEDRNDMMVAWGTPERVHTYKESMDSRARGEQETLSDRYPKSKPVPLMSPLRKLLPPPPPSPRQNSMRPLTPSFEEAPFVKMGSIRLHRDQQLLEKRSLPLRDIVKEKERFNDSLEYNQDETGEYEWELEEQLRQKLRKRNISLPPPLLSRGLRKIDREKNMMKQLTLIAPAISNGGNLSNAAKSQFKSSLGVIDTLKQRPGALVLLPPGVKPSSSLPSPTSMSSTSSALAPPAPSTSNASSLFLWLPPELQKTTENLNLRTELAREATRRAQIGLAQRMAREVLKLPFDFMSIHGTPEMNVRVGALAFRVSAQRLGQRKLRENWDKLLWWLSKCRQAEAKKFRLLSRMSYLIESFHDSISKKKLKVWYRWMRKMIWIENRQRWGSTKLNKILAKAWRRNQRRRMYNAFMKFKYLNEKYKADQIRKRMAASKVRKMLWRRMINNMKRVFFNLRRMALEPSIIKLQWAWRTRSFKRNQLARLIQTRYRIHKAMKLARKRKLNIRINVNWFLSTLLPPYVSRQNAVLPIQRCWRKRLEYRTNAATYIYYGWWLPTVRYKKFRTCMKYYRNLVIRIQKAYRLRLHQQMKPSVNIIIKQYRKNRLVKRWLNVNVYANLALRQVSSCSIIKVWRGYVGRKRAKRRKKYIARQERAALKLQRAWAINQNLFSTFVLTTSLKISEGSDVALRRRKRREVRWNATILVQACVRAMVARKRNKKWMRFLRRRNRIESLVWGSQKFLKNCNIAAINAQRYWRGKWARSDNYAISMILVRRRAVRNLSARTIQFKWMRCNKINIIKNQFNGVVLKREDSIRTCVGILFNKKSQVVGDGEDGRIQQQQVTTMSMFTHKLYIRNLHWQCAIESAERGRMLPFIHDIQRVYRGYVGRCVTATARLRRKSAMVIQNKLIRKWFARRYRRRRQREVYILGCTLYMNGVCKSVAYMNVMIYTPAAITIQNHLYRAWKSREPLRRARAATIVQCRWKCRLAYRERLRRRKGMKRKNNNKYGSLHKLWSIFDQVSLETNKRFYHPLGDMHLSDDIQLNRFLSRLGLRSLHSTMQRR